MKKKAKAKTKRAATSKPAGTSHQAAKTAAAAAPPAKAARPQKPVAPNRRTLDKRAAFLVAYSICGSIRRAAKAAHVKPARHYEWLKTDADYPARFKQAKIEAQQALEDEATHRATVGVFEPNVYQGRWIYPQEEYEIEPAVTDRRGRIVTAAKTGWRDIPGSKPLGLWKKSDALLMFRLRGEYPEKYRQYGSLELAGPGGGPIALELVERLQAARARVAARAASPSELPREPLPAPVPERTQ